MTQQPKQQLAPAIVVFDIDGVVRDVGGSYRRALADTVEHFTAFAYRPSQSDIDQLKSEGVWNNDWEASQELIYRYFEAQGQTRSQVHLNYEALLLFSNRVTEVQIPKIGQAISATNLCCYSPAI
jgi:HAD superfamily phosphatase